MKTKTMRYGKMIFTLALFLSFTFSSLAFANDGNKDTTEVQLRFIGNFNNKPVFQLEMENPGLEEFSISISDEDGTLLYFDKIRSKNFTRKFQVNTDEIQGNLRVEVKAGKTNKTEVYQINSITRFVHEMLVTKL
jgi:hypothetical protein